MDETTAPTLSSEPQHLANRRGKKPRLQAPWEDMKAAIAAGLTFHQVAKQFAEYHPKGWESLSDLMRKRAQREGWIVPSTIMSKANAALQEKGYDVPAMSQSIVTSPREPGKVGTLLVENMQAMAENASLLGLNLLHDQLQAAHSNPERLAPLVDAKGIVTAIRGARMAAGLDKAAAPVSFNLFGGPMSQVVTRDIAPDIRDVAGANLGEWSDE